MNETPSEDPHLLELILIFQQSAWAGLGKVQDPHSGKSAVNLPQAAHAIDMLAMLETKTRGNLAEGESQLLANALTQLRLNYVETASEQPAPEPEPEPGPEPGEVKPPGPDAPADDSD